jgi:hypothetical protein
VAHDIKRVAAKTEQQGFTLHADEKTVLNGFEPSCPTFENLTHVAEAIVSRA